MSSKNGGVKKKAAPAKKKDDSKRPMNAYQMFLADIRPGLMAKGLKITEVMSEGAKQWKRLKDKSEYEQRAAELKAKYLEKHPKPIKEEKPHEPKRSRSAYIIFVDEMRPRFAGQSVTNYTPIIGAEWNALSKEEKERYEEMAREEKDAFALESCVKRGVEPIEFGAGANYDM